MIKLPETKKEEVMVNFKLEREKQKIIKGIAKKKGLKMKELYNAMVDALIKQEG